MIKTLCDMCTDEVTYRGEGTSECTMAVWDDSSGYGEQFQFCARCTTDLLKKFRMHRPPKREHPPTTQQFAPFDALQRQQDPRK